MPELPTKDEYLKASRKLATGFGGTVDFADPTVGQTAQAGGIGDTFDTTPGQVFSVDQLPDPAVAVGFGLPAVVVPADLILESPEEAEHHVQGKTVEDIRNAELRRGLGSPLLDPTNKVQSSPEGTLEDRAEQGGPNARVVAAALAEANAQEEKGEADRTAGGQQVDSEGVQRADSGGTTDVSTREDGDGEVGGKSEGGGAGRGGRRRG